MLILPDASKKARQLLDSELKEPLRINLLVIGDNAGHDVMASMADVRAQALSSARRVIWVRVPGVLSTAERDAYTKGGTMPVVVMNLYGKPVMWLTDEQARDFIEIEIAFLQASGISLR